MALKDILLLLDLAEKPSPALDIGIHLAAQSGGHITGVALAVDPIVPGFVVAPIPVELIESARFDAMKIAKVATDRFEEAARAADVPFEVRISEVLMGGIPQSFIAAARLSDLIIIGQESPDHPEPLRDVLIETALFEGVAPILMVPYIAKAPLSMNKVLIAWDGSRPAARAIRAVLPLMTDKTDITILMVGDATKQPGEPGADVATWMMRHGLKVEVKSMPGSGIPVADTILNYASDQSYDLVVMGAYGHSWVREALIGGATRDVLRTMTVPILMAH